MIVVSLAERFGQPVDFYWQRQNVVQLLALVEILSVQQETAEERRREAEWESRVMA